jgi:hypothetical protein
MGKAGARDKHRAREPKVSLQGHFVSPFSMSGQRIAHVEVPDPQEKRLNGYRGFSAQDAE